jgi:hypothetical protein
LRTAVIRGTFCAANRQLDFLAFPSPETKLLTGMGLQRSSGRPGVGLCLAIGIPVHEVREERSKAQTC